MIKTATDTTVNSNSQTAHLATGVTIEYLLEGPADAPVLCFVHGLGANFYPRWSTLTAVTGFCSFRCAGMAAAANPIQPQPPPRLSALFPKFSRFWLIEPGNGRFIQLTGFA